MKINNVLFSFKYALIGLSICFVSIILVSHTPPFQFSNENVTLGIVVSSAFVLIIPGYLLFNLMQLRKRYEMDLFELLVMAFGLSLLIIEFLCMVAMETRLNSFIISLVLVLASLVLFLISLIKERSASIDYLGGLRANFGKINIAIYLLAVLFIIFTAALLFKIESPVGSGEDMIHISIIRKLLENPELTKTNIWIEEGIPYTYLYPGLHFMAALISRFSAIDPIIVYAKLRFAMGIISLLLIWTMSKTLFRSKYIAFTILMSCVALIYNGSAGHLPGFFCGQLIPVSHMGDISMGVILPLVLVFSFKYMLNKGTFNRFFFISLLLVLTITIVHVRETMQVLFYYCLTLVAYLIFNRKDKATIYKVFIFILSILILGNVYNLIYKSNVGHIQTYEHAKKEKSVKVFKDLLNNPKMAFSTPDNYPDSKAYIPGGKLIFKRYMSLAIPLSLVMLLLFRRRFWGLLFSSSIVGSLLLMRFNILSMLLIILTYSEIMFTPGRFFLYFAYIIFGLFIYAVLFGLDKIFAFIRGWSKSYVWFFAYSAMVCLFSIGILSSFLNLTQEAVYLHGTVLLVSMGFIVLSLIALKPISEKLLRFGDNLLSQKLRYPGFGLACIFLVLFPVYKYGGTENPKVFNSYGYRSYGVTDIFDAYKLRVSKPDISNFGDYCDKIDMFNLPLDVIEFIRKNVPEGNIFAYDIDNEKRDFFSPEAIFIPSFSAQYLAVSPREYRILVIDDEYFKTFKNGRQIIFNNQETDREKLGFIQRFKFTYILLDPPFYGLRKTFDKYKSFEKIFDNGNYSIYKIDRKLLTGIIPDN